MHISLIAEKIFKIGNFTVTNSLLASVITSVLLITIAVVINRSLKKSPGGVQSIIEMVIDWLDDLAQSVGGKDSRTFLPLVITFFVFILTSNWLGLLPGFGSIGFNEIEEGHKVFIPLFRGATADLNTTLALALISVFSVQFYGISKNKLKYLKRFVNFESPIMFFMGLLEVVSEFAKIISFSFRLFGNVFAGEVLIAVITSLIPVLVPIPFFGLEIFVGLIQALVFAMLTLVFINIGMQIHEGEEKENINRSLAGEEVENGN
jgi:F-type H+-transporting ATPase subunit a